MDYILIDFSTMRFPVFETDEGCGTVIFPEKIPLLKEKGYITEYSIKPTLQYDMERIEICLKHYISKITEIYKEEQIIIVDVRSCIYVSDDKTKRLSAFDAKSILEDNIAIDTAYQYAVRQLPKAHIIPFPTHMLCDVNHKWMLHKMHYIQEYYQYALAAMNIITSERYDLGMEKLAIAALCDNLDRLCVQRMKEFTIKTVGLLTLNNEHMDTQGRDEWIMALYSRWLVNPGAIANFLNKNEYRKIAIYGAGKLGKSLFGEIVKYGCEIAFIMDCDTTKTIAGHQAICMESEWPECDVIIVTVAYGGEEIKKQLQNKRMCPVISLQDVIDKY